MIPDQPRSTLFPYPTLSRSLRPQVRPGLDHGATPPLLRERRLDRRQDLVVAQRQRVDVGGVEVGERDLGRGRSEEHTSELQSRQYLVCRRMLDKKRTTLIAR